MSNLGEALPAEMKRVTKLISVYENPLLGGAGKPAIILMRASLDRATQALASGDIQQMILAYEDLKGFKA